MAKSEAAVLEQSELEALAKSLGIAKTEDIPPDKLKDAMAAKATGDDPAMPDPDKDKEPDKTSNLPGMPDDDPTKKPNPFENLDKSISQALVLAQKALEPHMQSLPPEIAKYFSSIPAPAPVEPSVNPTDPSPALEAAKAIPEIAKSIKAQSDQIKDLTQELGAMKDANALEECMVIAKSISPDVKGTANFLLELKKNGISDDNFKVHVENQRRMFVAANESDAFKEISKSSNSGGGASAYDKVMKLANEMIAKSEKPTDPETQATSIAAILELNPALAEQYEREMTESITPSHGSAEEA